MSRTLLLSMLMIKEHFEPCNAQIAHAGPISNPALAVCKILPRSHDARQQPVCIVMIGAVMQVWHS